MGAAGTDTAMEAADVVIMNDDLRRIPEIVDEQGAIAADARIVIDHAANSSGDRYAHMAIYPYPVHLIQEWTMNDGQVVTIRPIRPEDGKCVRRQRLQRSLAAIHCHIAAPGQFQGIANRFAQTRVILDNQHR